MGLLKSCVYRVTSFVGVDMKGVILRVVAKMRKRNKINDDSIKTGQRNAGYNWNTFFNGGSGNLLENADLVFFWSETLACTRNRRFISLYEADVIDQQMKIRLERGFLVRVVIPRQKALK